MKKINIASKTVDYLTLKEVENKFVDSESYEANGESIKRAAKGLYEAGKLRGWLFGAAAMGVAWLATSVINKLEEEFKADKG